MTDSGDLTLRRAAEECGVSRDTIKRRRLAGAFPNAYRDEQGVWMIPVSDLSAAGFRTTQTEVAETKTASSRKPASGIDRMLQLEHENELLQVQLEAEQRLRAVADESLADLRLILRLRESGTAPADQSGSRTV